MAMLLDMRRGILIYILIWIAFLVKKMASDQGDPGMSADFEFIETNQLYKNNGIMTADTESRDSRIKRRARNESSAHALEDDIPMLDVDDHIFHGGVVLEERQWSYQQRQRQSEQDERERQVRRESRLQEIQSQILDKLQLSHVPEGKSLVQLNQETHERIQAIYSPLADEVGQERSLYPEEIEGANTLHVITPSGAVPPHSSAFWSGYDASTKTTRLYLDLSRDYRLRHKRKRRQVLSAGLALYKTRPACLEELHRKSNKRKCNEKCRRRAERLQRTCPATTDEYHLTAYRYVKPLRRRKAKKSIITTVTIHAAYLGWVKLDMMSAVRRWLEKPKKNFGIELRLEDKDGNSVDPGQMFVLHNCSGSNSSELNSQLLSANVQRSLPMEFQATCPSLEVQTRLTSRSEDMRARRNARFSSSFWRKSRCSVEKFFVSIAEFGWDNWIVQPRGFEYSVCRGACVKPPKPNYFERHVARSDKNEFQPVKHASCCGPTKVKPLVIIHFDVSGNLTISTLNDFLISECGCQIGL